MRAHEEMCRFSLIFSADIDRLNYNKVKQKKPEKVPQNVKCIFVENILVSI